MSEPRSSFDRKSVVPAQAGHSHEPAEGGLCPQNAITKQFFTESLIMAQDERWRRA
jgi:hypothetical protein